MLRKIKKYSNVTGRCQRFSRPNRHFCRIGHQKVYKLLKVVHKKTILIDSNVSKMDHNLPGCSQNISNNVVQHPINHGQADTINTYTIFSPEKAHLAKLQETVKQQTKIQNDHLAKAAEAEANALRAQKLLDHIHSYEASTTSMKKRTHSVLGAQDSPPKRQNSTADPGSGGTALSTQSQVRHSQNQQNIGSVRRVMEQPLMHQTANRANLSGPVGVPRYSPNGGNIVESEARNNQ